MMMTLGMFVFEVKSLPYQQLQRSTQWRHSSQNRVGQRPAYQYLGPGEDTITLSGTLLPELTGGRMTLDDVRIMADEGKAWPLIEGSGRVYGFWSVRAVNETSSAFFQDGVPRKIDFTIDLVRVDESNFQAFRQQAATNRDAAIGLGLYTPRRSNNNGGLIA
jgi:uncharacterized protein